MGVLFVPGWGRLRTVENPTATEPIEYGAEQSTPPKLTRVYHAELPEPGWHRRKQLVLHVKDAEGERLLKFTGIISPLELARHLRVYARLGTTLYGRRFRAGHALLLLLPEGARVEGEIREGTLVLVWPGLEGQDLEVLLSCRLSGTQATTVDCTFTLTSFQAELGHHPLGLASLISMLPPPMARTAREGLLRLEREPLTGITFVTPVHGETGSGANALDTPVYTVKSAPRRGLAVVYRYGLASGRLTLEERKVWHPSSLRLPREELTYIFPLHAALTRYGPTYVYEGLYHGLPLRAMTRRPLPLTVRAGGRTLLEAEYNPLREPLERLEHHMATASMRAQNIMAGQGAESRQHPASPTRRSIEAARGMYEAARRLYPGAELAVVASAELPGHVIVYDGRRVVIRQLKPWTRPGIYARPGQDQLRKLLELHKLVQHYKYAYEADTKERQNMLKNMISELHKNVKESGKCASVCNNTSLDTAIAEILSVPAPSNLAWSTLNLYYNYYRNPTLRSLAETIVDLVRLQEEHNNARRPEDGKLERREILPRLERLLSPLATVARLLLAVWGISKVGVNINVNPHISYEAGKWVTGPGELIHARTPLPFLRLEERGPRRFALRPVRRKIPVIYWETPSPAAQGIPVLPVNRNLLTEREHEETEQVTRKPVVPNYLKYELEDV